MSASIIPTKAKIAAKRAFIRTTAQGYEALLATTISANVLVGLIRGDVDLVLIIVSLVVALVAPPLAGLRSYLSFIREGIPLDYVAEIPTRVDSSASTAGSTQAARVKRYLAGSDTPPQ